jgi:hypothetical protein
MLLTILVATEAWEALENPDRLGVAQEHPEQAKGRQTGGNGVVWFSGRAERAGDEISLLWNLEDRPAIEAFLDEVQRNESTAFFKVALPRGRALHQGFRPPSPLSKRRAIGVR